MWTGDRGLALGLIDTLGGLQEAIEIVRKMAGIEGQEDVNLVIYPRRKSLFGSFFRYLSVLQRDPLSQIGFIETYFRKLQLQTLTLMPYQISIN